MVESWKPTSIDKCEMSELNHPILVDKQLEQQLFTIDHKK
jgi:hypothetical protein